MNDLRWAFRRLVREPLLAISVCGSLALGVGINVAMFSVIDAAIMKPLPYREADRLVNIYHHSLGVDGVPALAVIRGSEVASLRAAKHILAGVEVFASPVRVSSLQGDESVWRGGVSVGLPALLGVAPVLGRLLAVEDIGARTVLISDDYWGRRFGRSPDAIGTKIDLADGAITIAGVMPSTFRFLVGSQADVWKAISVIDGTDVVARLAPGVSVGDAAAVLDASVDSLRIGLGGHRPFEVRSIDWARRELAPRARAARDMLFGMAGAVLCVLLVGCANISNLFISDTLKRRDELATQLALGAAPWRLARRLCVEVLVLTLIGGGLAIWVAVEFVEVLRRAGPRAVVDAVFGSSLPVVDARTVGCAVGLVVAVVALSSMVPVLRISGTADRSGLSGRKGVGEASGVARIRKGFQIGQVALTVVLLVQAGLFVRSVLQIALTPVGFNARNLSYADFRFTVVGVIDSAGQYNFASQLVDRLKLVPGISDAAIGGAPVDGSSIVEEVRAEGRSEGATQVQMASSYVGPKYFSVAQIAMRAGREFLESDTEKGEKVVIVSEAAARRFWPGTDPIGQRLLLYASGTPYRVVGVVADVKTSDAIRVEFEIYRPIMQSAWAPSILCRSQAAGDTCLASVTRLARDIDPKVRVERLGAVERLLREDSPGASTQFYAAVLLAMAVTALLTALVGLYGTLSLNVRVRLREIGVRVALGASPRDVSWFVLRGVVGQTAIGVMCGLVGAGVMGRYLSSQLFRVSPYDGMTIAVVVAVVLLGGVVSSIGALRLALSGKPIRLISAGL